MLVSLLTRFCGLEQRQAFSTSLAVILPLCVLSAAVYLVRGGLDLMAALPYLIGGTVGGWLGGRWFRGVRVVWLRRAFGLLLLTEIFMMSFEAYMTDNLQIAQEVEPRPVHPL